MVDQLGQEQHDFKCMTEHVPVAGTVVQAAHTAFAFEERARQELLSVEHSGDQVICT